MKDILQHLSIDALNAMQEETIASAETQDEIVLYSPTGSGKTLAFLISVLNRLKKEKKGIQAMVIVPSRELALQIESVFKKMKTGYKVNSFYGGHPFKTEVQNLVEPPALVIGTPGRILDHFHRKTILGDSIHSLVLDEFDKSLEFGFEPDMKAIFNCMKNLKLKILTSATPLDKTPWFVRIKEAKVLDYSEKQSERLTLHTIKAEGTDKLEALIQLILQVGSEQTLVFCNHRDAVQRIAGILTEKGVVCSQYHGGMEQNKRERTLIRFRNGSSSILICTDLAARGLDIPQIKHVVHYQLPNKEDAFVHRNGRTARMNATGTSYLVLAAEENTPDFLTDQLEPMLLESKEGMPKPPEWITFMILAGKKDKINKIDLVGLFLKKGGLAKEDLGLIEMTDKEGFVAVKRGKHFKLLQKLNGEKVKKIKIRALITE